MASALRMVILEWPQRGTKHPRKLGAKKGLTLTPHQSPLLLLSSSPKSVDCVVLNGLGTWQTLGTETLSQEFLKTLSF